MAVIVGPRAQKLAEPLDKAEDDVLAPMNFPAAHRTRSGKPLGSTLHSTNPLERPNGETKRRSGIVGVFPNKAAVTRPGALALEQNDERAIQRRYMTPETLTPTSNDPTVSLPTLAA